MRLNVYIVVISCILMTSACVQVIEPSKIEQNQLAVSSVWDIPSSFEEGSTFALEPKYVDDVSLTPLEQQAIYQVYAETISQSMLKQGYLSSKNHPDFIVGFGIALSEDLNDKTIGEKFGVTPGLQASDNQEKGSFLIYIEDTKSQQRVWRGTVQGFVQDDYNKDERKKRVEKVVNMVLTQFYTAG